MTAVLTLNSSNVVSGSNNSLFTLDFSRSGSSFPLRNKEVCISSLSVPFSWRNISAALGNNQLSYVWLDGVTYKVSTQASGTVVQDGYYSAEDLNTQALQYTMIQNGHYIINSSGNYTYLLEIVSNPSLYCIQINSFYYASLPAGSSMPAGASWSFGGTQKIPQLILTNTGLASMLGFAAATYPSSGSSTSNQSNLSSTAPQIDNVTTVTIKCTIANNALMNNNQIIYAFTPSGDYGSYLAPNISEFSWLPCVEGNFQQVSVQICDQNGVPLIMQDPTSTITLFIRDRVTR